MAIHRDKNGKFRAATDEDRISHLQKHTKERKLRNVTGGAFKLSKKGDQTVPVATWQNPHKQKSQKTLWTRRVRENQKDFLARKVKIATPVVTDKPSVSEVFAGLLND